MTYEVYGAGGVAILVQVLTDNRTRTVAELRSLVQKNAGSLGATGSVAWMFQKRGLVTVERAGVDEDRVMEVALEDHDDVQSVSSNMDIAPEELERLSA